MAENLDNTVLVGQRDQEGYTSDTSKNGDVDTWPISGGAQAVQEEEEVGLEDISNQIQLSKNQLGPCDKISEGLNEKPK